MSSSSSFLHNQRRWFKQRPTFIVLNFRAPKTLTAAKVQLAAQLVLTLTDCGDNLKNFLKFSLKSVSDLSFFEDSIYWTVMCRLWRIPSKIKTLRRCMQFLHPDVVKFTMSHTLVLSQNIFILELVSCGSSLHVNIPTHNANSSKNSILGLNFWIKLGSHWPHVNLAQKHTRILSGILDSHQYRS